MESTYTELADHALELLRRSGRYRIVILLVGPPGSGKSTVAAQVARRVNERYGETAGAPAAPPSRSSGAPAAPPSRSPGVPVLSSVSSVVEALPEYVPGDEPMGRVFLRRSTATEVEVRGRGGDLTAIQIHYPTKGVGPNNPEAIALNHPAGKKRVPLCEAVSMDGFHLPRSVLDTFDDAPMAHLRRGSEWTFDAAMVVTLVRLLQSTSVETNGSTLETLPGTATGIPRLSLPSFDHALKDPTPGGTQIAPETRIVIVEGLYLLLATEPWKQIHALKVSESWAIAVSEETCRGRVALRHVESGLTETYEAGVERYNLNDAPNGKLVETASYPATRIIHSV